MARYIDEDKFIATLLRLNKESQSLIETMRYKAIMDLVRLEPTADVVEVKHGKWITLEAEIGLYSCSLCEHKILRAECNYCPNCGAKMDGKRK